MRLYDRWKTRFGETCKNCNGLGISQVYTCPACEGTGRFFNMESALSYIEDLEATIEHLKEGKR